VGFAADFAYASYINRGLQSAADAAVLAATSQSAATSGGGYGNTSWLTSYGSDVFAGNIANLPVSNVTPTFTVKPNGTGGVIAAASYTYAVPTFISSIIGIPTLTVSGSAKATANPLTYIRYYILVDISQSMGIGATQSDMDTLYNRVAQYNSGTDGEQGCTFGCHVVSQGLTNSGGTQTITNEYLAHNLSPKVTLRIDSAVAAIQDVITQAQAAAGANANISIGLYTMNDDYTNGTLVRTISAPSTNYTGLSATAATIDLGNNESWGAGDSDFPDQLSAFVSNDLAANGSGASAVSPLNYVFIITDGLADVQGSCPSGHCTSALNPSNCSAIQAKATVGVIYTTYNPIYLYTNPTGSKWVSSTTLDPLYISLVQTPAASIASNLQSCATSLTYYYEASDGPAIDSGMRTLFASSLATAHLTQ
jgi:hypothetical protein